MGWKRFLNHRGHREEELRVKETVFEVV